MTSRILMELVPPTKARPGITSKKGTALVSAPLRTSQTGTRLEMPHNFSCNTSPDCEYSGCVRALRVNAEDTVSADSSLKHSIQTATMTGDKPLSHLNSQHHRPWRRRQQV